MGNGESILMNKSTLIPLDKIYIEEDKNMKDFMEVFEDIFMGGWELTMDQCGELVSTHSGNINPQKKLKLTDRKPLELKDNLWDYKYLFEADTTDEYCRLEDLKYEYESYASTDFHWMAAEADYRDKLVKRPVGRTRFTMTDQ